MYNNYRQLHVVKYLFLISSKKQTLLFNIHLMNDFYSIIQPKLYHKFCPEIAMEIGMPKAIIMGNILYWLERNSKTNKYFYEGKYWVKCSASSIHQIYPYIPLSSITTYLRSLVQKEWLHILDDGKYHSARVYTVGTAFLRWFQDKQEGDSEEKTPNTLLRQSGEVLRENDEVESVLRQNDEVLRENDEGGKGVRQNDEVLRQNDEGVRENDEVLNQSHEHIYNINKNIKDINSNKEAEDLTIYENILNLGKKRSKDSEKKIEVEDLTNSRIILEEDSAKLGRGYSEKILKEKKKLADLSETDKAILVWYYAEKIADVNSLVLKDDVEDIQYLLKSHDFEKLIHAVWKLCHNSFSVKRSHPKKRKDIDFEWTFKYLTKTDDKGKTGLSKAINSYHPDIQPSNEAILFSKQFSYLLNENPYDRFTKKHKSKGAKPCTEYVEGEEAERFIAERSSRLAKDFGVDLGADLTDEEIRELGIKTRRTRV